jgi:hypothetical protein
MDNNLMDSTLKDSILLNSQAMEDGSNPGMHLNKSLEDGVSLQVTDHQLLVITNRQDIEWFDLRTYLNYSNHLSNFTPETITRAAAKHASNMHALTLLSKSTYLSV